MNRVWLICLCAGMIFAMGNGGTQAVNDLFMNIGKDTFDFVVPLLCVTCFWNGILNVAKDSGLLRHAERLFHPLLSRLFPDVRNPEALGYIVTNVVVNMFGLGSAATPAGLKAMQLLQEENPKKDTASRPMVTFLVLNTAGVTLLSTSIIAIRAAFRAQDVMGFLPYAVLATACASIVGLLVDRWWNYRG